MRLTKEAKEENDKNDDEEEERGCGGENSVRNICTSQETLRTGACRRH